MAKKHGLDINQIPATGKGGRVTKDDVVAFMEGKTQPLSSESSSGSAAGSSSGGAVGAVAVQQPPLTGTTE